MTDLSAIIEIIEAEEYAWIGIRAHRGGAPVVGQYLGCSRVWDDGECTDDELNGISATRVTTETLDAVIARVRREYAWDGEPLVLVGGQFAAHGYDADEIIIRDNICLAVL